LEADKFILQVRTATRLAFSRTCWMLFIGLKIESAPGCRATKGVQEGVVRADFKLPSLICLEWQAGYFGKLTTLD